jgi:hypothetical protein
MLFCYAYSMQAQIFASVVSLLAAAGNVPPAPAGTIVALEPNQTATVRHDVNGLWQIIDSQNSETSGSAAGSDSGKPDSVSITFKAHPDTGEMMLIVRNHYGQALGYEALLVRGKDRPQRTSVCIVSAGLVNYESWPFTFEHIYLGNLRLMDVKGSAPDCK